MAYLGNTPTTQGFSPAIDYFSGTGSQTAFTLSRPVASTAQVLVVVNNVTQNPSSAFTVSGNTITFTGAPSAGTNNIYVEYTSPITQVQALTQSPSIIGPMYVSINGASALGGATNPIIGSSGSANNYVQTYIQNLTNGVNSSADFTAYPSNGTDAAGWVDMGITGPSFSQALFSVTGPNEAYLFGSAPSGSGTTGNLVIATDSTGTTNNIQFYNGGFNKAKNAQSATISANGLGVGSAVATSGSGVAFPATQNPSSDVNTLDDYEEGTFTPVITSSTGSVTSQVGYGKYTKIGNQVTVTVTVTLTNVGTAANIMSMTSFPFTFVGSGAGRACSAIVREDAYTGYAYMFVGSLGQSAGTLYTLSTNVSPPWTNNYQYTFSLAYLTN
jgi:hypothetical protein